MDSIVLSHFSKGPLVLRDFPHNKSHRLHKPCGLWLSDESDQMSWSEWCKKEKFGDLNDAHETKVMVKMDTVLHLKSEDEIIAFTNKYGVIDKHYAPFKEMGNVSFRSIDWDKIYSMYHGILITPFNYKMSIGNHSLWYYGWDCASGCFWNKDILEVLDVV